MRETGVSGALVILVACNQGTLPTSLSTGDAARGDSARPPIAEAVDAAGDAAADAAAEGNDAASADDASPTDAMTAPEVEGGYPTPVACDMDASLEASVTTCPPPISVCANRGQLMYFAWGQCVAGWCSWAPMTMTCPYGCLPGNPGRGATAGGCLGPPTR